MKNKKLKFIKDTDDDIDCKKRIKHIKIRTIILIIIMNENIKKIYCEKKDIKEKKLIKVQ